MVFPTYCLVFKVVSITNNVITIEYERIGKGRRSNGSYYKVGNFGDID